MPASSETIAASLFESCIAAYAVGLPQGRSKAHGSAAEGRPCADRSAERNLQNWGTAIRTQFDSDNLHLTGRATDTGTGQSERAPRVLPVRPPAWRVASGAFLRCQLVSREQRAERHPPSRCVRTGLGGATVGRDIMTALIMIFFPGA